MPRFIANPRIIYRGIFLRAISRRLDTAGIAPEYFPTVDEKSVMGLRVTPQRDRPFLPILGKSNSKSPQSGRLRGERNSNFYKFIGDDSATPKKLGEISPES